MSTDSPTEDSVEIWSYLPTPEEREVAIAALYRILEEQQRTREYTENVLGEEIVFRVPSRHTAQGFAYFTCTGGTRIHPETHAQQVCVEAVLPSQSRDQFLLTVPHDGELVEQYDHLEDDAATIFFWGDRSRARPAFQVNA